MTLVAALLLVQERVGPPNPVLPPSDPTQTIALFDRVCVKPFPDPRAFDAVIASLAPEFVKWRPQGPVEALVPGGHWQSPRHTLAYIAENRFASDLPHPQCTLTASAAAGTQAETLFPVLAGRLSLGTGKIVGHKKYRTAMWDLQRGAQRWRVIFGTERHDDRVILKLSMMNLGTRK